MKIHTPEGEIIRNLQLHSNLAGLKISKITFISKEIAALARLKPEDLHKFFQYINQRNFSE